MFSCRKNGARMLCALMVFWGCLPFVANAQFSCVTNTDGVSVTITGYSGTGGAVTIPDTINGLTVVAIGNNSIWFNTNITSLTVTNDTISIGSQSFLRSSVLTNVVLGSGVTNIGFEAFAYINSLLNISVDPANPYYSSVGGVLFNREQTMLIQCPAGLTGSYTVPSTVTCIGTNAFYYCSFITDVTLSDSVTNIQDHGFDDCGMTNIYLGTNLTWIGSNAFLQSGLSSVSIPASVSSIGAAPFRFCGGLPAIAVDPQNPNYSSTNGVLMDKNQTTILECPGGKPGTFAFPTTAMNVGSLAFYGCSKLTNVFIPEGLVTISDFGFDSANLRNVQLPDSLKSIGNYAFYLDNLNAMIVGSGVTNIGAYAFSYCYFATRVCFRGDAPALDASAFYSSSPTVYYPLGSNGWGTTYGGRPTVAWDPVSQCTVTNINGAITILGYIGFSNSVVIPDTISGLPVVAVGDNAFYNNLVVTNVTLPAGMTRLGNFAFYGCTALNNITFPAALTNIGNYTFQQCAALHNLRLPANLKQLGVGTFSYCNGLTNVVIPAGVTNLEGFTFAYCPNLKQIYFQGKAPAFGESVFLSDNNLTVYYLPGTTGWTATAGGRPAVLWNPQASTSDGLFGVRSNRFGFTITGPTNVVIVTEATTNLVAPAWSAIGTNTLTNGYSYFSDVKWTNNPDRFYRFRSP